MVLLKIIEGAQSATQNFSTTVYWHGLPAEVWLGIVTIIAVLVGPIAALGIQAKLDERRQARNRKVEIFRRLVITRGAVTSLVHIDNLNLIDVEYKSGNTKDREVLDKWRQYSNHLYSVRPTNATEQAAWESKRSDLLVQLLLKMSEHLRMPIDESVMTRLSYRPQLHIDTESEFSAMRKAAIEVFSGRQPLKIESVVPAPATPVRFVPPGTNVPPR
jgi:hypothetical protein